MQTRFLRSSSAALLPLMVFTMILAGCGGESTGSTEMAASDTTAAHRAGTAGSGGTARGGSWHGFRCLKRYRHCKQPPTTPTNTPPAISGSPQTEVDAGSGYDFTPVARDADSDALTFAIQNKPEWASFSAADGHLSGTPDAGDAGSYSGIVISVTDNKATAALPAFEIQVLVPDSSAGGSSGGGTGGGGTVDRPPTIRSTPASSVAAGNAYSFTPTASDPDGDPLTFMIQNKPAWASFNTATGALTGTPTAANVGTTSNIVISVKAGTATASLPAFSITVQQAASGSASLSWTAPTTNSDGTTLTNLAGYRIHYGTTSAMTQMVQVATPGVTTYLLGNLTSGTWYFAVSAYASNGTESTLSNTATKTIP
ncbi:MAG: hypothetical protein IT480_04735 [Gammaproteobacteria bacterium]|nr:hypothetical protein [Gammaproteobacteria bacterium]